MHASVACRDAAKPPGGTAPAGPTRRAVGRGYARVARQVQSRLEKTSGRSLHRWGAVILVPKQRLHVRNWAMPSRRRANQRAALKQGTALPFSSRGVRRKTKRQRRKAEAQSVGYARAVGQARQIKRQRLDATARRSSDRRGAVTSQKETGRQRPLTARLSRHSAAAEGGNGRPVCRPAVYWLSRFGAESLLSLFYGEGRTLSIMPERRRAGFTCGSPTWTD